MDASNHHMSEKEKAEWVKKTMTHALQSTMNGDVRGDESAVNQMLEIACNGDMDKFREMCMAHMKDFFLKNPAIDPDPVKWVKFLSGVHGRLDEYAKEEAEDLVKRYEAEKDRLEDVLDARLEEDICPHFRHNMTTLINFEKPGFTGGGPVSASSGAEGNEGASQAGPCSTFHAVNAEHVLALLRKLLKADTFISKEEIEMMTEGVFHLHERAMYHIEERNSLGKKCAELDKPLEKLMSKADRTEKQSQMLSLELSNGSKQISEKEAQLETLKEAIKRIKVHVEECDHQMQRAKELNQQVGEARLALGAEFAGSKAGLQNLKETGMKLIEQTKLFRAESKAVGKNISEGNKKLDLLRTETEKEEAELRERMSLIESRVKEGEANVLQAKHRTRIAMLVRAHEEALTNIRNFESSLKRSKDGMTREQIRLAMSFWERRCDELADLIADATSLSSEELMSRDLDPLLNAHDETATTGVAHVEGTFEFLHRRQWLLESAGLLPNTDVTSGGHQFPMVESMRTALND